MRRRNAAVTERRTQLLQVILAADELAAIEEFRFQARMPNRSAAVRELLRRGMARASRAGRARPRATVTSMTRQKGDSETERGGISPIDRVGRQTGQDQEPRRAGGDKAD
jgi:hypothetical protein